MVRLYTYNNAGKAPRASINNSGICVSRPVISCTPNFASVKLSTPAKVFAPA